MKVVAKPIEMVAGFEPNGTPHLVRFRLENEDKSFTVIKVNKVLQKDMEKLAGNNTIVFKCQSIISGIEKIYEIKHELNTMKWMLFKI